MTTKMKHLLESASLLGESAAPDGTWKVRLISEGRGSSGTYSAQLLESYHPVFDDVLSFEVHPEKGPEHRSFKQIVGRVVGETWLEQDENGLTGIYGNYRPDDEFRSKLEQYKDRLGLSIFIAGEGREADNGEFLVESFDGEDPYRSVDVVIAAGRGGRFEESLKKIYADRVAEDATGSTPGATSAQDIQEKETEHMTPEQFEELKTHMAALVTAKFDSLAEAKQEKDKEQVSVEEALTAYAEKLKAIEDADLFPKQVEALKAHAAKGEDITDLLEEAKTIRDDARTALQAESKTQSLGGRILGEGAAGFGGATAWGARR